jgi:hypothetical protein
MSSTSRLARRSAAVLAVVTATALSGCGASSAAGSAAPADESCEPGDDAAVLPDGVEDGSRLFVTTYRSYLVQVTCGRLELVEPTGVDSCFFLDGDVVRGYPC